MMSMPAATERDVEVVALAVVRQRRVGIGLGHVKVQDSDAVVSGGRVELRVTAARGEGADA